MTDCYIPGVNVSEFLKRFEKNKLQDKRIPLFGIFEITPFCNLRCVHCYVTHCQYQDGVLNYNEVCHILDQIAEEGCLFLLLTGGEPLLRKDFLDIYIYAKNKGISVYLFTNGTLVTPEIARCLHDLPPSMVEISIYGATKETYEKVTGVKDSFEKCMRGIELILEQNIPVTLKTMVLTINRHEIKDMQKLAENFGIKFRFDPILNPGLDGSSQPYQYRLSPEEVVKLEMEYPERSEVWSKVFHNMGNKVVYPDSLYNCGAGKGRFHIDAYGKLQMCTMARTPEYNLQKGSFHYGWHNFLNKITKQKLEHPTKCRECDYRPICPICPGWNMLEYDSIDVQPIEYLCQLARLRVKVFDTRKSKLS